MKTFNTGTKFILLLFALFLGQCNIPKPTQTDATLQHAFVVLDTTGLYQPGTLQPVAVVGATVTLRSKELNIAYRKVTDTLGEARFRNIVASSYEVTAQYPLNAGILLLGGKPLDIWQTIFIPDTLYLSPASRSPLLINEIYYAGPVNNVYFFYDQFIELVNRSDTTVYLDGKIIARVRRAEELLPDIDRLDYVQTVYTYRFPGNPGEQNWPVPPGTAVVIAVDALDHSQSLPTALNLEQADFEFYNQYSADFDNPEVPNLRNLNPTRTQDFLMTLTADAIILADGTAYDLVEVQTSSGTRTYINIPVGTILDGVEYKANPGFPKILTRRVDSGIAGIGLNRYSGKSIQRSSPHQDTNNSTIDFTILDQPTPGQLP